MMAVDLKTSFANLTLRNPLVASASPLTNKAEHLRRLEDAGIAAVVLPSLFEEQIEHEEMELHALQEFGTESFGEALDYFPPMTAYNTGTDRYLELIHEAKSSLEIPIIASLNGVTTGGWLRWAKQLEDAGADALELNVYLLAADPRISGAEIEEQYLDLVRAVRKSISIPLAVKVGPHFSSIAHMMVRLQDAGANGLVLFNRFMMPDVDLESLQVYPHVELSSSYELRLPLRWIAILRDEIGISLAATSGVHTSEDVVELILCGADATMTTSALLRRGPDHARDLLYGLRHWMEENEYSSIEQMKGSLSHRKAADPSAFERANYVKTLISYTGPFV